MKMTKIIALFDLSHIKHAFPIAYVKETLSTMALDLGRGPKVWEIGADPPDRVLVEMLWGYRKLVRRNQDHDLATQIEMLLTILGVDVAAYDARYANGVEDVGPVVDSLYLKMCNLGTMVTWDVWLRDSCLMTSASTSEDVALADAKKWHRDSKHSWRKLEYKPLDK